MNKSLSNTIGTIALFLSPSLATAAQRITSTASANVYYRLTPDAAAKLNLDLERVTSEVKPTSQQEIGFHLKEDGEIDLSIYEDGVFTAIRPDIVSRL